MAMGLNRAQLIGHLGQDPDFKTTPNGTPVCTIRVATSERFKTRDGDWQERTEWHNVTLWARQAEVANEYLKKGSKVFIEGRISTRTYEKDGITRYFTEVVAQNLMMLDSRGGSGGSQLQDESSNFSQQSETKEKPWQKDLPEENEEDDDIPF